VQQKMAQSPPPHNGTTQPVDIKEEGRSPTVDLQWLEKWPTKPAPVDYEY